MLWSLVLNVIPDTKFPSRMSLWEMVRSRTHTAVRNNAKILSTGSHLLAADPVYHARLRQLGFAKRVAPPDNEGRYRAIVSGGWATPRRCWPNS
jgi:hypothetical protein